MSAHDNSTNASAELAAAAGPSVGPAGAVTLAAVGQALQDAAQLAATYGSTAAALERLVYLEREHETLSDTIATLRTRLRHAQRSVATAESDARRHKAAALMSSAAAAAAASDTNSAATANQSVTPFDADAFVDFVRRRFACRGDLTLLRDALVTFQTDATEPQASDRVVVLTIEEVQTALLSAPAFDTSTSSTSQRPLIANGVNGPDPRGAYSSSSSSSSAWAAALRHEWQSQGSYERQSREEEEQEIHLAAKQLLSPVTFTHVDHDGRDGHNAGPRAAAVSSAVAEDPNSGPTATTTTALSGSSIAASIALTSFIRAQSAAVEDESNRLKKLLPRKPRVKKPSTTRAPMLPVVPTALRLAPAPLAPAPTPAPALVAPVPALAPLAPTPAVAAPVVAAAAAEATASTNESTGTSADIVAADTNNPVIISTTGTKNAKKRKVVADDTSAGGVVIQQNLVWPSERRNITEMKASSRYLELKAVLALDATAPWNDMYRHRPTVAHILDYKALDPQAQLWFVATLKIQFVWRRELWERLHWLPMSESVCTGAMWEKYRQTRKRRAKHAVTAWRKVYAQSIQMIEAGLLPADVWCDPALWYMPATPIYWLPDSSDVAHELKLVDAKHAVRCYHVHDLRRHPFYALGLVAKYPAEHELPSFAATMGNQLHTFASDDELASFALSSEPVSTDATGRQSPVPPTVLHASSSSSSNAKAKTKSKSATTSSSSSNAAANKRVPRVKKPTTAGAGALLENGNAVSSLLQTDRLQD